MYDPLGHTQILQWTARHLAGPEPLEERLRRFRSMRKALYWHAVDMHEKGKTFQHRKFGVGAAALVFRSDRTIWNGQALHMLGFNSKDEERGIPRRCAEQRLFDAASDQGYTQVVGIVVVGQYQPDDVSGHECTTLHPCFSCREMMREHPLAWPDMPIITALPPPAGYGVWSARRWAYWKPTQEQHSLRQILDIHKTT